MALLRTDDEQNVLKIQKLGLDYQTVKKPSQWDQVIWARIAASVVLNIVYIGALAVTIGTDDPPLYFFFLGVGGIGEFLVMYFTW